MCFYYAIAKKNPRNLIKYKVISEKQLALFDDHFLVSGFEHPEMPVISSENPEELSFYRWGLVPETVMSERQAADFLRAYSTLNANGERIFESKIYREPIMNRRCLVLCSGFFEWRKVKGKKIPYYISLKDDSLFVFAGVWDRWTDEKNQPHYTYSVLTTDANPLLAQIHNTKKRMPVILSPESAKKWLLPTLSVEEIKSMIKPIDSKCLKAYTVKQFLPIIRKEISPDIVAYYHYPDVSEIITDEDKLEFREKSGDQLSLDL